MRNVYTVGQLRHQLEQLDDSLLVQLVLGEERLPLRRLSLTAPRGLPASVVLHWDALAPDASAPQLDLWVLLQGTDAVPSTLAAAVVAGLARAGLDPVLWIEGEHHFSIQFTQADGAWHLTLWRAELACQLFSPQGAGYGLCLSDPAFFVLCADLVTGRAPFPAQKRGVDD